MDHKGLPADLTDKTVGTVFMDFMTRCARLEELFHAGERFLRGYNRAVEMLRAPLSETSSMVDDVIKANYTHLLNEYVEAGFSNNHDALQNISKLHSCKLGLEDHLVKEKVLLDELESLKDNATGIISHNIDQHFSNIVFNCRDDNKTLQSQPVQEDAQKPLFPNESLYPASLMAIIVTTLKLEYTMQENIIRSLDLNTSSSVLESYSLFWELRPDVDDDVMHEAFEYVSGLKAETKYIFQH